MKWKLSVCDSIDYSKVGPERRYKATKWECVLYHAWHNIYTVILWPWFLLRQVIIYIFLKKKFCLKQRSIFNSKDYLMKIRRRIPEKHVEQPQIEPETLACKASALTTGLSALPALQEQYINIIYFVVDKHWRRIRCYDKLSATHFHIYCETGQRRGRKHKNVRTHQSLPESCSNS